MTKLFGDPLELDEERCWREWRQKGSSLTKVAKKLESEGFISQRTGKRFSSTSILHAAWRFAVNNPDEAYEIEMYHQQTMGAVFTEDEWKRALVQGAKFVYAQSQKKLSRFIAQRGLQAYV